MPGHLPEGLRIRVYEAYAQSLYGQFMVRVVALQRGTMSLEKVDNDVFEILGYDGGRMDRDPGYRPFRDHTSKSHRPDLYEMFVEWSTGKQSVFANKNKEKTNNNPCSLGVIDMPAATPEKQYLKPHETQSLKPQSVPEPLPETQRPEVCHKLALHQLAFHQEILEQLADKVHKMERHCASGYLNSVDKNTCMFGRVDTKMPPIPDDIATAPAESLCLEPLTAEVLAKDVIALDTALFMSPIMLATLRAGAGETSGALSLDAIRLLWQKELSKRVPVHT